MHTSSSDEDAVGDEQEIRCLWENRRFPKADFDTRSDVGRIHARHREEGSPLHTSLGDPVASEPWKAPTIWYGVEVNVAERSLSRRARRELRRKT